MARSSALTVVEQIYAAIEDPTRWPLALGGVAQAVGAQRAMIGMTDFEAGAGAIFASHEIDLDAVANWSARFATRDPWVSATSASRAGDTGFGSATYPHGSLHGSEFYEEAMRPAGVEDAMWVITRHDAAAMGFASFFRKLKGDPFEPFHLRRYQQFAPHLRRAATLRERLSQITSRSSAESAALDLLPFGVWALDDAGAVISMNVEAARLVAGRDGLRLEKRRLTAALSDDAAKLDAAIARALGRHSFEGGRVGATLLIARPAPRRALHLLVSPIVLGPDEARPLSGERHARAIVVVSNPDAKLETPEATLQRLLGLAPAEARVVASLTRGLSVKEHAFSAGVTEETARGYLKSALRKTGMSRQTDLVALVLRSVASLAPRG